MTAVLQKYKLVLIVLAFVLLAMLVWIFLSRQNFDKIPSRGVFVLKTENRLL